MVYFLSDAHLGSRAIDNDAEHQQKVVNLLTQMGKDATAIYLLGDIFDFWYEYFWDNGQRRIPKNKQQFEPILKCLKELTDQGIDVHYFIGNHDIWTFGWLAKKTGVIVHKTPLEVEIYGKRIFMAHGDGLIPANYADLLDKQMQKRIRAFKCLRAFFHNPIPQFLFRLMPPCLGNAIGYEWARRSRLKEFAHPCPYKGEHKEELVLFAKEMEQGAKTDDTDGTKNKEHHDYYIFGHRHIELDLMLARDARVIILGDMFKLWTYAQMSPDGTIELKIMN
ncbi:MAG: UDP-2,3-diacylglucosamine diphosphatase [Paludibacteraceae bacterium]|nr:UDP-2,3-diacylglucosamine diphosphatase [Paludibacteraceae bacterium]